MFSIIIPYYNTDAAVFDRLLQSIEKQSIKPQGLELIIIDDHSKKSKRPKVTINIDYTILRNTRNCGPGYSRQRGIEAAKNDYVLFMDSDDAFFSNKAFEGYIAGIKQKADIIFPKTVQVINTLQVRTKYHVDIWGQCFNKSFLNKHNIKFSTAYYGEDLLFSLHASQKTSNIYSIDDGVIIQYYDNENSLTHVNPSIFGLILGMDLLLFVRYAYENNFDRDIINQTICQHLWQIRHVNTDYIGFFFVLSCLIGSCAKEYCDIASELYVINDDKVYIQTKRYVWRSVCDLCKTESRKKQRLLKRHFKRCLADGDYLRRIHD